jgi:TRAP-type C4-dicarboxylate transport system permease small subunit
VAEALKHDRRSGVVPSRSPRWYSVPARVFVLTFIGTLLTFSVTLFFAIFGTVILAAMHGVHPDMRSAYRYIALPVALVAGGIIFVVALINEIRHYRQSKTLTAIERLG